MNYTIDTRDLERLRQGYASFSDRRFQSALAQALNQTARAVANEWGGQMYTKIDRPTQPTRNAAVVSKRADVGSLVAEIRLRGDISGGQGAIPPSDYLAVQEFGGGRTVKKFERALQARGSMPPGFKVVPGKHAKLDGFGNISRGQIVQVLNQLGASLSVGYQRVISRNANKRARSAARAGRLYVALPMKQGQVAAGIYERAGDKLLPVFFFVSRVQYRKRLVLQEHAEVVIKRDLPARIQDAIASRMRTLLARGGVR